MNNKFKFPILDSIEIKSPCHESWDRMKGGEKSRFCDQCSLSVTNLSALTRREAETFLSKASQGRACVRYTMNSRGEKIFKPTRIARFSNRAAVVLSMLLAFIGISQSASADEAPNTPTPVATPPVVVQGGISAPKVPTTRMGDVMMGKIVAPKKEENKN